MKLDLSVLDPKMAAGVREIAQLVCSAGGRALVVGGAVRDLTLGSCSVKDVDIEVYGIEGEQLRQLIGIRFEYHACGVSFGVMKLKGLDIDISLPRRESKRGEGHRAFFVDSDPFLSIPEAASRRDFTINAMYADPLTGELIDPYGGLGDLKRKILRHVSDKFREDPLRVLRGMQFVARFGLKSAPETIAVCREMQIEGLAAERLFEEWSKLLEKGVVISSGLEFLRATEWIRYFPELMTLAGDAGRWLKTLLSLDHFAAMRIGVKREDIIIGFAVLCRYLGSDSTERFLRRLTDDSEILAEVPRLVKFSLSASAQFVECATDGDIRRLALESKRIDRIVRILRAYDETDAAEGLETKANRLGVSSSEPQPILMGRHLIEMGCRPGKDFSRILSETFEAQLDDKFSDLSGAMTYAYTLIESAHFGIISEKSKEKRKC